MKPTHGKTEPMPETMTPQELNSTIAREREVPPPISIGLSQRDVGTRSPGGEWCIELAWLLHRDGGSTPEFSWQPRHNYAEDLNAAIVLFRELPGGLLSAQGQAEVEWLDGEKHGFKAAPVGSEARAICLAWLEWKEGKGAE